MSPRSSFGHPIYKIVKTFGVISGPILEPEGMLFPPRHESGSKVDAGLRFGAHPSLVGTARGAPEHVNMGVKSMSYILTSTRLLEPPSSHLGSAGRASGTSFATLETSIFGSSKKRPGPTIDTDPQIYRLPFELPIWHPQLYIYIYIYV